jgi:DtxR family Mn-dependent transcriptional regulator
MRAVASVFLDVDYWAPIDMDAAVAVDVRVVDVDTSSWTLEYRVGATGTEGEERLAATATTIQVAWDVESAGSQPLPDAWRPALESALVEPEAQGTADSRKGATESRLGRLLSRLRSEGEPWVGRRRTGSRRHIFSLDVSKHFVLSAKMEDYLKVIYELQREGGGPVSTSDLAAALDVTAPTATSAMETLADHGFVEREKYKGATLTPEGETVALEVVRHHRLLETYLAERLGYDWTEVHDEADRLEHHISEEFERRVADVLGDPEVDPHGDPIPRDSLEPVEEPVGSALGDHGEGDEVVVQRVRDRDPQELAYIEDVGVTPGTAMTIVEVAPIGLHVVRLDSGAEVSLPEDVAGAIRVRPAEEVTAEGVN